MLRTISQPMALSCDIPAGQKRFFSFIMLGLIFYISNMLGEIEKQKQEVSARVHDAKKHIDWLICFY